MFDPLSKCVALIAAVCLFAAPLAGAAEPAFSSVHGVRLYTLDCGHLAFKDFGLFSDTGEYDGKAHELAAPCFVIRHPKGVLLWDTGLGDGIAANKDGVEPMPGIRLTVAHTLIDQLKAIGFAPADVTWLALSHVHFDHTGNANLFPESTWILDKSDLAFAEARPTPFGVSDAAISGYKTARTQMIDGDYDVFGDGSVVILKAPGHTPGHQVLEVKLRKSGRVILSGDLYHSRANRQFARVPKVNASRADTLASIDRIEKIVKNTHARFVIQHDPEDFEAMPKSPAYLD